MPDLIADLLSKLVPFGRPNILQTKTFYRKLLRILLCQVFCGQFFSAEFIRDFRDLDFKKNVIGPGQQVLRRASVKKNRNPKEYIDVRLSRWSLETPRECWHQLFFNSVKEFFLSETIADFAMSQIL